MRSIRRFIAEEGGVPPVMRDKSSEAQPESGVFESGEGLVPRCERNVGILPGTPFAGGPVRHFGVFIEQESRVRINEREVPKRFWHRIREAMPCFGKKAANILSNP